MKSLLAAVAISMASTAAIAQDSGWYVGGGFGQSKAKDFCSGLSGPGVTCDDTDVAVKAIGGYQFTRNFALEFGATGAGSFEARGPGGRLNVDVGIAEGTAVGILPLGSRFSVFGKLGLYTSVVDWELRTAILNDDQRKTNTDFTYGLGLGFALTPKLVLRAEWQRYQDVDAGRLGKSDADLTTLGLVYRFF